MLPALIRYKQAQARLWFARWRMGSDLEAPEEEVILDEMDELWRELSDTEREAMSAEGPVCWPFDPNCPGPDLKAIEAACKLRDEFGLFLD